MAMRDYVRWRLWTSHHSVKVFFAVGAVSLVAAIYSATQGDWIGALYCLGFAAPALAMFLAPRVARKWLYPEPVRRSQQNR